MIEISDVHKAYGQFEVVKGVDLRVDKGEVLSIIGGSGSGKSTLLMCINGLEPIQRGSIRVDGIDVHARGTDLNRLRRKIGIVFQQVERLPPPDRAGKRHARAAQGARQEPRRSRGDGAEATTHVGLGDKLKVFPQRLSGGQQQRMAIARALAMSPDYMLFDEATSALDPQLVGEVLDTMRLLAEEGMTMVLVTHEIRFARDVSDRVAFFRNGLVHEIGTPDQVIGNPQRPETVEFLRSVL
ncbi:amino acid ABC transporter ATP-binding protein [Pseudomonas aeruginosa]|nr:amino acid ABC transporter ATP-binding protein [Pseudomonas aeruginosa]